MVSAYEQSRFSRSTSGVREIHEVYGLLTGRVGKKAIADRSVYTVDRAASGHGHDCKLTTLSPSDAQVDIFFAELAKVMPQVTRTRETRIQHGPNHIAVVTWIQIGPIALLLGSDLEHTKAVNTGWHAIVGSKDRPPGKACVYKVAHHGSKNADFDGIWKDMLIPDPYALLTPYGRGHKLPTKDDASRIGQRTKNAYISALVGSRPVKNPTGITAVDKTLREGDIKFSEPVTGTIRIRNRGLAGFDDWDVEVDGGACELANAH
jgi:hypothetical protein